eukprot:361135-Chlamydomonas_euryale.AAC.8
MRDHVCDARMSACSCTLSQCGSCRQCGNVAAVGMQPPPVPFWQLRWTNCMGMRQAFLCCPHAVAACIGVRQAGTKPRPWKFCNAFLIAMLDTCKPCTPVALCMHATGSAVNGQ